jgi:hypothetical protein
MANVCLTQKQEKFFKLVQQYHRENGTFPNSSQAVKLLADNGIKAQDGSIKHMYSSLFLKGAFTNGGPLTDSLQAGHVGGGTRSIDVSKMSFTPRNLRKGRTTAVKPANDAIAAALLELLKSSPRFNEIAAILNA